jgi:hypothetical protein
MCPGPSTPAIRFRHPFGIALGLLTDAIPFPWDLILIRQNRQTSSYRTPDNHLFQKGQRSTRVRSEGATEDHSAMDVVHQGRLSILITAL